VWKKTIQKAVQGIFLSHFFSSRKKKGSRRTIFATISADLRKKNYPKIKPSKN